MYTNKWALVLTFPSRWEIKVTTGKCKRYVYSTKAEFFCKHNANLAVLYTFPNRELNLFVVKLQVSQP